MSKNKNENKTNEEIIEFNVDDAVVDKAIEPEITDPKYIEIVKLCEENENLKASILRLKADFENYKKRNADISKNSYTDGATNVIVEFFPLFDSFDRAMATETDENSGINKLNKQLESIREALNITEIQALGEEFNPNYHNAVMQCEDAENSGKVMAVLQKGYKYKEKIIRYAMVKVAK